MILFRCRWIGNHLSTDRGRDGSSPGEDITSFRVSGARGGVAVPIGTGARVGARARCSGGNPGEVRDSFLSVARVMGAMGAERLLKHECPSFIDDACQACLTVASHAGSRSLVLVSWMRSMAGGRAGHVR